MRWLEDAENPWGVPVLDLRPFALTMLSSSRDPRMATYAMSYRGDDGRAFVDQQPPSSRVTDCELRLRIDRVLLEGVLFTPTAMEDKWALYFRGGRVLCIRSWTRQVMVSAPVRIEGDDAIVGPITGTFVDDEPPERTVRQLEFLLRSHALEDAQPAPLITEPAELRAAATEMFALWGRRALFATAHELPPSRTWLPLRTDSLLHIAVARGDRPTIERYLADGVPFDVLATDGLGLPHWALVSSDRALLAWLLDRGCPVDVRSAELATPLMNAAQSRNLACVELLLARGADVNARDARGFTSLHRAAELGELAIARALADRGATAELIACDKTALELAEDGGHAAVVELLRAHAAD